MLNVCIILAWKFSLRNPVLKLRLFGTSRPWEVALLYPLVSTFQGSTISQKIGNDIFGEGDLFSCGEYVLDPALKRWSWRRAYNGDVILKVRAEAQTIHGELTRVVKNLLADIVIRLL
jgi:hypothetical protein